MKSDRDAACKNAECGHALSDHVNDKVMQDEVWITVHRCIVCERDGGTCTDSASIFAIANDDQR